MTDQYLEYIKIIILTIVSVCSGSIDIANNSTIPIVNNSSYNHSPPLTLSPITSAATYG